MCNKDTFLGRHDTFRKCKRKNREPIFIDLLKQRVKIPLEIKIPFHCAHEIERANASGDLNYISLVWDRPLKCGEVVQVTRRLVILIGRQRLRERQPRFRCGESESSHGAPDPRNRRRRESRIVKIQFRAWSALGRWAKTLNARTFEAPKRNVVPLRAWLVGRSATFAAYPAFSTPFFLSHMHAGRYLSTFYARLLACIYLPYPPIYLDPTCTRLLVRVQDVQGAPKQSWRAFDREI